ncbi:MAG: serine/threonine-protein kinase [Myxococcota bacterium]
MSARSVDGPTLDETIERDLAEPPEPPSGERGRALSATLQRLFGVRSAAKIGRYEVLSTIARGGMGVVYRARDPELQRDVAVKVVRTDRGGDERKRKARLLREARSLAALEHPNVLAVYDVGTDDAGDVFLALELVEGTTLTQWQRGQSWQAICSAYARAGAGLAAAHDAGLVHRDFKPANVLVGPGTRVRVCDFGLVVTDASASGSSAKVRRTASRPSDSAFDSQRLTEAGTVLGTPAYMSPEQEHGEAVDASSDQFSFCVALYEAVYGEHPFDPTSRRTLRATIAAGPKTPPRNVGVPRHIAAAIRKGLHAAPSQRHASMQPLLHALRRRRGRAPWLAALGVTAVGGAAVAMAWSVDRCADPATLTDDVWSEARQRQVQAAVQRAGAYGAYAWPRLSAQLDAYGAAWNAASLRACRGGAAGDEHADARTRCLARAHAQLGAVLATATQSDAAPARELVAAVASLPPPHVCDEADPEQWPVVLTGSQAQRAAATQATALLLQAEASRDARHSDAAVAAADAAAALAAAHDLPALAAAADLQRGLTSLSDGFFVAATEHLQRAYFAASEHDARATALRAATALVDTYGSKLERDDEAKRWLGYADQLRRQGIGGVRAHASLEAAHGRFLLRAGHPREAIEHHRLAAAERGKAWGEQHPAYARALSDLALTLAEAGQRAEAQSAGHRALSILVEALGPEHADVAVLRNSLAFVQLDAGADPKTVIPQLTQARDDLLRVLPADHPSVAGVYANLGAAYHGIDDTKAIEHYRQALDIRTQRYGPDHRLVATLLSALAVVYQETGDLPSAIAMMERGIAATEAAVGPEHESLAVQLFNLGTALEDAGRRPAAIPYYERSVEILERSLGPLHPHLIHPLVGLSEASANADAAIGYAERALSIGTTADAKASERIPTLVAAARALHRFERDDARVLQLAERAVSQCQTEIEMEYACKAARDLVAELSP